MQWQFIEPKKGDIIRVKFSSFYHYGIYLDDDNIVQFGLSPVLTSIADQKNVKVCLSNMDTFLNGEFLEVGVLYKKELKNKRSAQEIEKTALARLGEGGYNILYNNCEHFAYECVFGQKYCSQTERVREYFHNLPVLDVYLAKIPDGVTVKELCVKQRNKEINSCGAEKVRIEKYCVFKLLEYALERTFGLKMPKIKLNKNKAGRWECPDCYLSLSHTDNIVCVALSRKPVGVDVESSNAKKEQAFANKILTNAELDEYNQAIDKQTYLSEKWSQKESIFKTLDKPNFLPNTIETKEYTTKVEKIDAFDKNFMLAVANQDVQKLKTIKVENIVF